MKIFTAGLALAFAGVLAVGCGGSQKPKAAAGPSCADAAANIAASVQKVATEQGVDAGEMASTMQAIVNERCPADGWSKEAIACFAKADVQGLEECAKLLTPEQDQKMQQTSKERLNLPESEMEGGGNPCGDGADPCGGAE